MTTPRPPELQLIYDCRDALGLSMGQAARIAGISDTYWRIIESGERKLKGRRGTRTLARMAWAVKVPAGQMKALGRADIESDLARIRLEHAESMEQAQAEAGRMVETLPGLTERQRQALRARVAEDIHEVRDKS